MRCCRSSSAKKSRSATLAAAQRTIVEGTLLATSLRLKLRKRIGFSTLIRRTTQRISGFQSTALRTPRAAEGVITS